jgi:HKD family nuclease
MSNLILLPAKGEQALKDAYSAAFQSARELYILSAYLTSWNPDRKLSSECKIFRLIVGKDYGITRKAACEEVLRWLPKSKLHCFKVAAEIGGFHPKAMFWKDGSGRAYALVGSSNLTEAAFRSNHEANSRQLLTEREFEAVRGWIREIERSCRPVGGGWLDTYKEAKLRGGRGAKNGKEQPNFGDLRLPQPAGLVKILDHRRRQMAAYAKHRSKLMQLFRDCAAKRISKSDFYAKLPEYWSVEQENRFQGAGWERQGKSSDFHKLCRAFVRIVDADADSRDDVVAEELDVLAKSGNAARRAFLSEMLCQRFPDLYPVVNEPVEIFLSAVKFKGPRGATEGAEYIDLAQRLRATLRANREHPAKNLAELDAVIWLKYHKTKPRRTKQPPAPI